jgi:hypothetical protein
MSRDPLIRINLIVIPSLPSQSIFPGDTHLESFVSEKVDCGVPVLFDVT